jgi:hypothetical protein
MMPLNRWSRTTGGAAGVDEPAVGGVELPAAVDPVSAGVVLADVVPVGVVVFEGRAFVAVAGLFDEVEGVSLPPPPHAATDAAKSAETVSSDSIFFF